MRKEGGGSGSALLMGERDEDVLELVGVNGQPDGGRLGQRKEVGFLSSDRRASVVLVRSVERRQRSVGRIQERILRAREPDNAQERRVDRVGQMVKRDLVQNVSHIHLGRRRVRCGLVGPVVEFFADPREDADGVVVKRAAERHGLCALDGLSHRGDESETQG